MANYADYVKPDPLQDEIEDAAEGADERREAATIPDRFKGKTVEEVAASYVELEREYSRQGNIVGDLRKSVDTLLELKSHQNAPVTEPESKPVTTDELYTDPDASIRRLVNEEASKRVKGIEDELASERSRRALDAFTTEFPSWQEDAKSAEMLEWIKARPHRIELARRADNGDLTAAADLFSTYGDVKEVRKTATKKKLRQEAVEDSLETPGAAHEEPAKTFSRRELTSVRIRANKNDQKALDWLAANDGAIRQAYQDGTIVD